VIQPFQRFIHAESAGGVLLLAATAAAMVWANSPWADSYTHVWGTTISLAVGSHALEKTLLEWINDGLMAMFFFVIGLEIKREILVGELSSIRQAVLPLLAAAGGAMLPAGLYYAVNASGPGSSGWGIPMATDIAFTLGILSLLGRRVPLGLKVFLTALAIADDLFAVLVIALFYTSTLSWTHLGIGGIFILLLMTANVAGLRHPLVYSLLGIGGLWLAFLFSGVHATIAGVIAAMTIPARPRLSDPEFLAKGKVLLSRFEDVAYREVPQLANRERQQITSRIRTAVEDAETPLQQLEQGLHPWVTVVVMPLFALANAGIGVDESLRDMLINPVAMGIILGLLVGKPVGIVAASWLSVRGGWTDLPHEVSWVHLWAAGCLAGIGFTMSLFIAGLAFPHDLSLMSAKIGILAASTIAGTVGWILMKRAM
jgi:NhaA family Na+:H+ antiporter